MELSGNPKWADDASALNRDDRNRWWVRDGGKRWVADVRKRDGYTCGICGKQHNPHARGVLEVHHKAGFTPYPLLRSAPQNGACLCEACHTGPEGIHSNAGRALREQWEREALAELGHLLTQPEAQAA